MRRLIVTSAARRDLAEIVEYVARSSGQIGLARSFGRSLLAQSTRLAALPGTLGTPRPELGSDVRAAYHRQYVLVFRYEPDRLRLLRVIEGHRNLPDQFEPPEA